MAKNIDRKSHSHNPTPEMNQKMHDSIKTLVEFAMENYGDEKLNELSQFTEVGSWYSDAKEGKLDKNGALAAFSSQIAEKLIETTANSLQQAMIGGLGIKLGNSKEKMIKKMDLKADFEYEMEFVKELESKQIASCKITFKITGSGALDGVKIHHTADVTEIEISVISLPLSISITRIRLEVLNLPLPKETLLPKPIPIVENRSLQLEGYSFNF